MQASEAFVQQHLKKLAVQCFVSTFVVEQTLVLRMNICGKNRQLLVAVNRCASCKKKSRINQKH
jgi:hypothetical protein